MERWTVVVGLVLAGCVAGPQPYCADTGGAPFAVCDDGCVAVCGDETAHLVCEPGIGCHAEDESGDAPVAQCDESGELRPCGGDRMPVCACSEAAE